MNTRQNKIIEIVKSRNKTSFSEIFESIKDISERTLSRDLAELVKLGLLGTEGGGRSLRYKITLSGRFFIPVEAVTYSNDEPDERAGVLKQYQFDIWQRWPPTLFSEKDLQDMQGQTDMYRSKIAEQSVDIRARELERFVIELSWKSSQIEGNTYTLLDTERLLKEGIASEKNTEAETKMILNHKKAFCFVQEQLAVVKGGITREYVEEVQSLLMKNLLSDVGLRKGVVGITGSNYRPLDNQYQIKEALEHLLTIINQKTNVFDRALTALLGISYIQPFVDGNKRTARLVANGILMTGHAAPLSYRNVDESSYRAALLVFYEQLSVVPMKEIFKDQYTFAVEQYS